MRVVDRVARGLRRLTGNLPLLVTVALHAVAVLVAAVWVVSETIVGNSKRFEPPPATSSVAQKRVEHRVQVARRASAAGGAASPVSANRIRSTAASALSLPALPDLPQAGTGGFGGMGSGGGMGFGGAGAGVSTSLGAGGLGGRGFMSTSFLGLAGVKVQRVVFVVDVGRSLMDIRKGGFRAFEIIRAEILRLVGELPPSAQFGVVLFDDAGVNRFAATLVPGTVSKKQAFFDWIAPVNADGERLGAQSAAHAARWEPAVVPTDPPGYRASAWAAAVHAAVELAPETVLLITGTAGTGTVQVSESEREQREAGQRRAIADLARQGLDPSLITQSRQLALAEAQDQLKAINRQLEAQGRPPFVVRSSRRFLDEDFQTAIRRAGFRLDVSLDGWTDREGKPIWEAFSRTQTAQRASEEQLNAFLTELQRMSGRPSVSLNIFLFTGAETRASADVDLLTRTARRQGGRFSLLTSARLDELAQSR